MTKLRPYQQAGRIFRFFAGIQLFAFVAGAVLFAIADRVWEQEFQPIVLLALLFLLIPFFYYSVGKAIGEHKDWGRIVGAIIAALMLLGFPVGTVLGAYILWALSEKGWQPDLVQEPSAAAPQTNE